MTRINIVAAIMLALPVTATAQGATRYVMAEVVRVEPIHAVISTPVSSRTCWQEPVYETVYAEPQPYYGSSYGSSYAIGVSSGHGHGRGYGRGHGHGHGGRSSYALGYSSGPGYGYPGGAGERVLGTIAGGLLGNQIGSGSGKVAATFFGAVLGDALVADSQARRYNSGYASAPTARTVVSYRELCREQTAYRREERVQWYDVTYQWGGELYHTQTRFDPGDRLRVQVEVTPSR